MATEREWAAGYLAQARADLEGAKFVGAVQPSVFATLMQMAFEKFAKAALLRSGSITLGSARSSHRAATLMVAAMKLQRDLIKPIGGRYLWHAAFEVVEALERAHPSLAQRGPQLEYPWETQAGAVHWPARDLPIAAKLGNPRSNLAAHLMDFATKLDRNFDSIFP